MSSQNVLTSRIVERHPLACFFALALGISWLVEFALIAVKQGWTDLNIPLAVHYLASFGPALAAVVTTGLVGGQEGLRELFGRVTKWRVGTRWVLLATVTPVVLFALGALIRRLVGGEWLDLRLLGQANYLPYLGISALFLFLATFGFGEEIGWRGFALPRLQKTRSVSSATLVMGIMWAVWHVPAFFYLDTYEKLGLFMLPGFVFGVLCGAVLFTWIYNATGGSVLMVALWHGIFDFLSATQAGQGIVQIVMGAGVVVWALVVANVDRPWNFSRAEKHIL